MKAVLPLALFLGVMAAPTPQGLTPEGQRVLAVVALAVVLWSTEALPMAVTSIVVVLLLFLTRGVPDFRAALFGFASPTPYFLISVLTMSLAVLRTGLAGHLALYLLARARGSPASLYGQMLVSFPLLTFLLPSASTRSGILIPVYQQILSLLGVPLGAPLARAIMMALGSLNRLASTALLTGGIAPITAAALIGGFSWTRWFVMMALPEYAIMGVGGVVLYLLYRPGRLPTPPVQRATLQRNPVSPAQVRVSLIVAGASLLWLTDPLHHWPAAVPALLALVVILMPRVGVLSWSEFEKSMSWSLFFILAASISIGNALVISGAAAWLADWLVDLVSPLAQTPVLLVALLMVAGSVFRVVTPAGNAYLALFIPVAMSVAQEVGLNPVVLALAVTMAGDSVAYYPAQGASTLMAFQTGHLRTVDVLRFGVIMAVVALVVVVFLAVPYWQLIGEPLVP